MMLAAAIAWVTGSWEAMTDQSAAVLSSKVVNDARSASGPPTFGYRRPWVWPVNCPWGNGTTQRECRHRESMSGRLGGDVDAD